MGDWLETIAVLCIFVAFAVGGAAIVLIGRWVVGGPEWFEEPKPTWTIRPVLAWYDLWVGAYWDRQHRRLYILPLPCIGIVIEFAKDDHDV